MLILYKACLVMIAVINLLPLAGLLSADRLARGYGIDVTSADLQILLQHRALLFGLIGGFVLYACFVPAVQLIALSLAGISMVGFVVIAQLHSPFNEAIARVVWVDMAGILVLLAAVSIRLMSSTDFT